MPRVAERELIYRIRFVRDESSDATLKAVGKEAADVERMVARTTAARRQAADADEKVSKRAADTRIKEEERAAREKERIQQRETRARERAARDAERIQAKQAKDEERARLKSERDAERTSAKLVKEQERVAKEQERARAKAEKEQERATAKAEKEAKRAADAEVRERRRVDAAYNAETARLTREADAQSARFQNARRAYAQTFQEGSEGLLRMTRGFVALGIVGEKDLESLARSLVKLQAGVDLVAGASKLWMKSADAVRAYREAVQAAAAAEAALEAVRARSSGAGAASGGLRAGGSRLASGVAVAGGTAIGGRVLASGATGAGGAGGAAVAGAGGTVVAFIAALTASVAALKVFYETVTGGATAADSWSMKIASWEIKFAEFVGLVDVGSKTLAQAEERNAEDAARRARREAIAEAQAPLFGRGLVKQQALEDIRLKYQGTEGLRPAVFGVASQQTQREIIATQLAQGRAGTLAERQQLLQREADLAARLVTLAEQRHQIERDINERSKTTAQETLRLRQDELRTVQEQLKDRRQTLASAYERFGQMSPQEQARAIEAQQKATRLGPQALSREERATLRGIGLEGTTAAAQQGDVLAAERAGFSRFFGGEERRAITQLSGQERRTTLEITGQRELLIRLERQEAAEVSKAAREIADLVKAREDAITAKIQAEVKQRLAEISKQTNTQFRQRAGAVQ